MKLLQGVCSCLGHWLEPSAGCLCNNWRAQRTSAFCFFNCDYTHTNWWTEQKPTHQPSSCKWRFPLHKAVCCWGTPVKVRSREGTWDRKSRWNDRIDKLHSQLLLLTRVSLCSVLVQASMKVWAMTDREASTTSVTWTSKMKWGFFKMFTQNRRGRLKKQTHRATYIFCLFFCRCILKWLAWTKQNKKIKQNNWQAERILYLKMTVSFNICRWNSKMKWN